MKTKNLLWKIIDGFLFLEVAGMLVVVCFQVLGRVISQSVAWSEEMTRNLFVWTINFGMAVGFRKAEHARVTFIYDFLPKNKITRCFQLGIYFISSFLFFVVVAYWDFGMTIRQIQSHEMSPALGIPMFLVTLPLGLCAILAIVGLIQTVFFDKETRSHLLSEERSTKPTLPGGC